MKPEPSTPAAPIGCLATIAIALLTVLIALGEIVAKWVTP